MAKVTGPLMSFAARGQLGKAIVFIAWRGIADVRMYLKPKNPQTIPQMAQRDIFTSAVEDYHTLKSQDTVAWALRASGQPYSGFNMYVGKFNYVTVAGATWNTISSVSATPQAITATIHAKLQIAGSAKVQAGTTRGTWIIEVTNSSATTAKHIILSGMVSATDYYYMLTSLKASAPSETGHYAVTTT